MAWVILFFQTVSHLTMTSSILLDDPTKSAAPPFLLLFSHL